MSEQAKLVWKAEGQGLFKVPPPNVVFNYKAEDLAQAITELMDRFGLTKLEVKRPLNFCSEGDL